MSDISKPKVNSASQKELDKAEKHFEEFKENIDSLTLDRMNEAKRADQEPQTKLSQKEIDRNAPIYLKPKRSIMSVDPKTGIREKFNENFRSDYNFAIERVNFVAENYEIIGETLEFWTHPFGGMPAELWEIPTNRVVNGPRHVAEQLKKCIYHRLVMKDNPTGADHAGSYFGTMIADVTKQRLDAHPVSDKKSVFMGASGF